MPTKKKTAVREVPVETKAKHIGEPSLARQDRRSWEAWTDKENHIFFDSLVRHSRNWAQIAADLVTKRQEQVRTYYYRVLRKISKLLSSVQFAFDNRDRIQTLMAMTSYWEAKCETKFEETTHEFAEAVKERILRQKQAVDMLRTKRLPAPEKVILQLLPRDEQSSDLIAQAGFNPKLQLTLKATKPIASVVEHVSKKWVTDSGACVAPFPIRLYPFGNSRTHRGWGIEDAEVSLLTIYHTTGCPTAIKFEYAWPESPSSFANMPSVHDVAHDAAMASDDSDSPHRGMYDDDEESLDRVSVTGVDHDMANMTLQQYDDGAFPADQQVYAPVSDDDMLRYEHPSSGDDEDDVQQPVNAVEDDAAAPAGQLLDEYSFSQYLADPVEFFETQSNGAFLPMRSVADEDDEEEPIPAGLNVVQSINAPLSRVVAPVSTPSISANNAMMMNRTPSPTTRAQPNRVVLRVHNSPPGVTAPNTFSFSSGLDVSTDFFNERNNNSIGFSAFAPENSNSLFSFTGLGVGTGAGGVGTASNNNSLLGLSFGSDQEGDKFPLNDSMDLFSVRSSGTKPRHDRPVLDQQEQAVFSALEHKPKRARKVDDDSSNL